MTVKSEIKYSFSPTKYQLNEIKNWLIEEINSTGFGFYDNWNCIESAYNKREIATISENNQTIGFITWSNYAKFSAIINITAIKSTHRNKGVGKKLISKLFTKLIFKNIYSVRLECAPSTSELFWRHIGFTDFPSCHYWNGINKNLYKILVPHLNQEREETMDEYIELWDNEPDFTEKLNSTWKWKLIFKDGTRELKNPIIHPCRKDWRIRWKNIDKIIIDEKVKRFGENEIIFEDFIVINKLPEL